MFTHLLDDLARVSRALDGVEAGEDGAVESARRTLRRVELAVAGQLVVGAEVDVDDDHERVAIEVVTAYIDGAERGDGYALLAEVVADNLVRHGGETDWVAGVVAALARLSGDLARHASGTGEWSEALGAVQQLASMRRDTT
jgi:hypothetical protein